jgi:hypothetical protein
LLSETTRLVIDFAEGFDVIGDEGDRNHTDLAYLIRC